MHVQRGCDGDGSTGRPSNFNLDSAQIAKAAVQIRPGKDTFTRNGGRDLYDFDNVAESNTGNPRCRQGLSATQFVTGWTLTAQPS